MFDDIIVKSGIPLEVDPAPLLRAAETLPGEVLLVAGPSQTVYDGVLHALRFSEGHSWFVFTLGGLWTLVLAFALAALMRVVLDRVWSPWMLALPAAVFVACFVFLGHHLHVRTTTMPADVAGAATAGYALTTEALHVRDLDGRETTVPLSRVRLIFERDAAPAVRLHADLLPSSPGLGLWVEGHGFVSPVIPSWSGDSETLRERLETLIPGDAFRG